jgi:hypothetical protein
MDAVFIRLLDAEDKETELREALNDRTAGGSRRVFRVDPAAFAAIPGSPFVYWAGPTTTRAFRGLPPFLSGARVAKVGLQTSDDFRYARLAWEPDVANASGWKPFPKGGGFSPFFPNVHLVVNWRDGGRELFAYEPAFIRNEAYYGKPGLTWSRRPFRRGAFSAVGPGCVFADTGPMVFANSIHDLPALACILNSDAYIGLLHLLMPRGDIGSDRTLKYEVGYVTSVPIPDVSSSDDGSFFSTWFRRAWALRRSLNKRVETSPAFVLPGLLLASGGGLGDRAATWAARVRSTEDELASIQAEIDERCFALYGIDEDDRRAITEGFGGNSPDAEASEDGTDADAEDEADAEAEADTATLAAELVAWAVGVAFGRFDVRLATGARELPGEPEPFDPLPVCSPATLTGGDGLPLDRPPAGYPLSFPADGILVDDPGHPRDLTSAVRAVFDTVFGATADAIWQEAAALLDPKGHDLRTWLARDFFGHHLARHSKSRRKAPILWQLGPPSATYSTWCYAHRLTRDSLFALARDVVAPKLALEERRQTSLVQEAGPNPTAKQRAELAAQDAIVAELRVFADEVRRVAPLWNPDLDDGIVLAEAPLWRLVPHKPWAKELKGRWDDLAAGKYDWAHLSMYLWPERVVPKCATDRSLAIAHGLEEVFWVEGADGKWSKRATPTRSVEELVAERTSPAVKAALADLLAAPVQTAGGRGRARKGE